MERFEEIYELYRGKVEAYVRRRAPADLVDDVVADVFVVCLRRIDDVPTVPLPWLYAVARKTLANERRRQARTAPAEPSIARDPEPLGDVALAAAFATLGENDRDARITPPTRFGPTRMGGGYLTFEMDEPDHVRGMYGRNYERLARIKAQVDPENVFRSNQNIQPAP